MHFKKETLLWKDLQVPHHTKQWGHTMKGRCRVTQELYPHSQYNFQGNIGMYGSEQVCTLWTLSHISTGLR